MTDEDPPPRPRLTLARVATALALGSLAAIASLPLCHAASRASGPAPETALDVLPPPLRLAGGVGFATALLSVAWSLRLQRSPGLTVRERKALLTAGLWLGGATAGVVGVWRTGLDEAGLLAFPGALAGAVLAGACADHDRMAGAVMGALYCFVAMGMLLVFGVVAASLVTAIGQRPHLLPDCAIQSACLAWVMFGSYGPGMAFEHEGAGP